MAYGLKDCVWKISTIRSAWLEAGLIDANISASDIGNEFSSILKETLRMSEKEVNLYKSETLSKTGGQYIFSGSEAPMYLKEFIDIFKKNRYVTAEEKKQIYFCLISFMPTIKNARECREEYKKAVETLREGTGEGLTWDDSILDRHWINQGIKGIVEDFYIESRVPGFFEDRVFWEVDGKLFTNVSLRKKIYGYEYDLVKCWERKWDYIMNEALGIRRAERFDNGFEKCLELKLGKEEREKFYTMGICDNEQLEKSCQDKIWLKSDVLCNILCSEYIEQEAPVISKTGKTKEECLEGCKNAISNILGHNLKHAHKNDFDYMRGQSFEELEGIRPKVREKQLNEIYSSETGDTKCNGLNKLYAVREKRNSSNVRKSVLDYI